jgi:hypothetical protein
MTWQIDDRLRLHDQPYEVETETGIAEDTAAILAWAVVLSGIAVTAFSVVTLWINR